MNNSSRSFVTIIVSLVVGAAVGIFAFNWFVGGAGAPSATIVAPTLDVNALPTLNPTEAFAALTQVAELDAQITALEEGVDAQVADAVATADALNAQVTTLQDEADAQVAQLEETIVALQSNATPAPTLTSEPTLPEEPIIQPEIITENVTKEKPYKELEGGYVHFEDKQIHKDALKSLRPDLFRLTADSTMPSTSNFGTKFPSIASKGDIFVRVDILPNRVYKFDGAKWIEINKSVSDTYLHDQKYIQYLIGKIEKGEYDVELLSENEKIQIEQYLKNQKT